MLNTRFTWRRSFRRFRGRYEIKQRCCPIHTSLTRRTLCSTRRQWRLWHLRSMRLLPRVWAGGAIYNTGEILFHGQGRLSTWGGEFCDVMKSGGRWDYFSRERLWFHTGLYRPQRLRRPKRRKSCVRRHYRLNLNFRASNFEHALSMQVWKTNKTAIQSKADHPRMCLLFSYACTTLTCPWPNDLDIRTWSRPHTHTHTHTHRRDRTHYHATFAGGNNT